MLYAGLFTAGLIALALFAQVMIGAGARRSAAAELKASGSVYDRLWQAKEQSLAGTADVLARDFGFRSAVASGDVATISSALDSLRARAGVPQAVLIDAEGRVLGDAGALSRQIASLPAHLADGQRDAVIAQRGQVYRVVTAPVLAPNEIGRIALIERLGEKEMRGLEKLSAIPLNASLVTRAGARGWAGGGFAIAPGPAATVQSLDTGEGRVFAMLRPLPGPGGVSQAAVLLTYPMARAMRPYRSLQIGLLAAGAAWLCIIVIGTGRLSRGIARPLALLDRATRRLEEGEHIVVPVESADEIGRLSHSFNVMAAGIRDREARITHPAFHDTLTDLPNRAFFHQSLEQAVARAGRTGERLAVLCLDLDGFKAVNDTLGHPIGDGLLRRVAARLSELSGDGMVARLGGDEFAMVVAEAGDGGCARRLAQAIVDAVAIPIEVDGHTIATSTSIGIAMFPADGREVDTLVKNADLALYRAKQDGRGGYRFFEQALDEAARRRRQIETDLRVAIRVGQLALHFQPIVGSGDEAIRGFEALLRWAHPERGYIAPVEFIPVAEETGLIVALGEWVLHEACRAAVVWPEHVRVAVNVSPLQFRSPGFQAIVLQALAQSGLAPGRLELEITETVFLDGEEGVLRILHALRSLGVRIALDDFGTGYSSLSYLRSFPVDKLKVDRSFVTHIADDASAGAIVKAIVDLATALHMETTAEGVEDAEQQACLEQHGCSTLQGYLFSRPVDVIAATALLRVGARFAMAA